MRSHPAFNECDRLVKQGLNTLTAHRIPRYCIDDFLDEAMAKLLWLLAMTYIDPSVAVEQCKKSVEGQVKAILDQQKKLEETDDE